MIKVGDKVTVRLDRESVVGSHYLSINTKYRDNTLEGIVRYINAEKSRYGIEFPFIIYKAGYAVDPTKAHMSNAYCKGKTLQCAYVHSHAVQEKKLYMNLMERLRNQPLEFEYPERPRPYSFTVHPYPGIHVKDVADLYKIGFDLYRPEFLEPIDSDAVDGVESELMKQQKIGRNERKASMFGLMYGMPFTKSRRVGQSQYDSVMAMSMSLMAANSISKRGEDIHQSIADQLMKSGTWSPFNHMFPDVPSEFLKPIGEDAIVSLRPYPAGVGIMQQLDMSAHQFHQLLDMNKMMAVFNNTGWMVGNQCDQGPVIEEDLTILLCT